MKKSDIVNLKNVTREDIPRLIDWLDDKDVYENWFGKYTYNEPAHLGYEPKNMINATEEEWNEVFHDPHHEPHRSIFSIYLNDHHIGEAQLSIDESLGDAQLSVLIGDKSVWHKGYGTSALTATVEKAFTDFGLFRIWADIPEYNEFALRMFEHLGFRHEGTLRKSRPHEGSRYDSIIMGMLSNEYKQI